MIEVEYKGYLIKIGSNQDENDMLVKTSNSNDYWAHADGYPSAHAIVVTLPKNESPPKSLRGLAVL